MKELTAATKQLKLEDIYCECTEKYNCYWCKQRFEADEPLPKERWLRASEKKRKWTKPYVAVPSELVYEHFVFPEDVHHPQFCHELKEKFGERPAKVIRAFLQEEIIPMEHCHWLEAPTQAPKPSEHIQADA